MASTSMTPVEQFINVGSALRALRYAYQHEPARLTALNKAALNIVACNWAMTPDGLQIQSATDLHTYYRVTRTGCTCRAKGVCWHREALTLLEAMGHGYSDDAWDDDNGSFEEFASHMEAMMPRISPAERAVERLNERAADADYAAIQEAADELFA